MGHMRPSNTPSPVVVVVLFRLIFRPAALCNGPPIIIIITSLEELSEYSYGLLTKLTECCPVGDSTAFRNISTFYKTKMLLQT